MKLRQIYDSYKKARSRIAAAVEDTDGVQSDQELPSKRQRIWPSKSSTSSDEDEPKKKSPKIPPPPTPLTTSLQNKRVLYDKNQQRYDAIHSAKRN